MRSALLSRRFVSVELSCCAAVWLRHFLSSLLPQDEGCHHAHQRIRLLQLSPHESREQPQLPREDVSLAESTAGTGESMLCGASVCVCHVHLKVCPMVCPGSCG